MTVLDAVADAAETDPADLPPLYESVDPDALDGLFSRNSDAVQPDAFVSFEFAGYSVKVHSTGTVVVCID